MHILNINAFYSTLKKKGFRSIGELADYLGIHRNTIHYYLSGHGVFPKQLERIIETLELNPHEILIKKEEGNTKDMEKIVPVIDALYKDFPDVTFVMFGSRSQNRARKYSDWDIGVFSKNGLPHEKYRKILLKKSELEESLPYFIDIVNLNNSDILFLKEIIRDCKFLCGRLSDLLQLQKKVHHEN